MRGRRGLGAVVGHPEDVRVSLGVLVGTGVGSSRSERIAHFLWRVWVPFEAPVVPGRSKNGLLLAQPHSYMPLDTPTSKPDRLIRHPRNRGY